MLALLFLFIMSAVDTMAQDSCSLKQLKEQQNYDNVWAKLPGGTQDLVPHGTNGYGVCATDPELLGWPELWVCIDGKWGPTRRFRKCPQ
ncbi:unnamed protein product [Heligmosomoides polygyrus]|uniref:Thyroglobulin type-1 domain-containing protein n=1 Tax=Heligmosomoides polygyrus TaxID=6339 RepID=A0A183GH04_HELPZ|nr:unnamed protein product [Heligmosomoides polygyrus]